MLQKSLENRCSSFQALLPNMRNYKTKNIMAKDKNKPKVHEELDGLNIKIDSFGEMSSNTDIDKINKFLNEKVTDRKLAERKDEPKNKKQK